MTALIRGESSDCGNPKLDVFMRDGTGNPVNVSSLSFQIFEKVTTPGTPIQIFPAGAGAKEVVNLNACPAGARVSQGRYHADYTVPLTTPIGTHEVRWFVKLTASAPEQSFFEEFEVLSEASLLAGNFYISIADVRAAGLNNQAISDSAIQSSICLWQQILERTTRQWFLPFETSFYLDGTDSDALHLPVAIISISEVRLNDDPNALDPGSYRVYNGRRLPDDRKNPRIKLTDPIRRDIFTGTHAGRPKFRSGRQNQYIAGVFGYVEPDGSTPEPIKRALLKLVIKDVSLPLVSDPTGMIAPPPLTTGLVSEEWTDGHKIKYQLSGGPSKARAPGLSGLIDDPEVQMIIKLYKSPIAMATPAGPSWS